MTTAIATEKTEEIHDDDNPIYTFATTNTSILKKIVSGEVDANALAKKELENRGLDNDGKWVGFDRAKEVKDNERARLVKRLTEIREKDCISNVYFRAFKKVIEFLEYC